MDKREGAIVILIRRRTHTHTHIRVYIYRSRYFICIVWYSGEFRANFARIYGGNEIYILNYLLEIVALPVQFSCVQ